jgi:ubiquinol-cytochrome c reductase cytochrome c subunit
MRLPATAAVVGTWLFATMAGAGVGQGIQEKTAPPERHEKAVSPEQVERGRKTFVRVGCYECHGREAQGASTGPRLGPNPLPPAAFTRAVRLPRNEMPPYSGRILSDADLADLYAFVAARPRPHVLR